MTKRLLERSRAKRAKLAKKDLLELAGEENIELWQQAIANWIQQHQGAKVSLWQLQQALGMPLVEIWRLAVALAYAVSVGEAGGVLSGCKGFLD